MTEAAINTHEHRDMVSDLDATIERAQQHLLSIQYPEGYWWGELESNPTMEAEYILLLHFMGVDNPDRVGKLARHIRSRQRDDGTWGQYYDAAGDLSTTTECYYALKLAGFSADEPFMRKARDFILSRGGVPNTRVFTKIWLALTGQWEWHGIPVLPPELMMLPSWFPINIYDFASWARATIVPMIVLSDRNPVRPVPEWAHIDELFPQPRSETDYSIRRPKRLVGWEFFFYATDYLLRRLDKLPWKPTRAQALKKAKEWIIGHQEEDGSWGGIQPPWVYSLMALSALGHSNDDPVIAKGLAGLDNFTIEDGETLRLQACVSPLWDTGLALVALLDSGMRRNDPSIVKAGEYLLDEQVLHEGDWRVKAKNVPAGGWAFEFHNDVYPDLDDTAEIVMALDRIEIEPRSRKEQAVDRAVQWVFGMQSSNGGWAAFDKDNTKSFIANIPFADFGETIDPPSVDVTAHILEMFGQLGYDAGHPAIAKALDYLFAEQEDDGPWFGRWGVNYIYGAGSVLPALEALGVDMSMEPVQRCVRWIIDHQNQDGGWGESCASYVDPNYRGRGPSTPSQTAWALNALIAANATTSPAATRGTKFLIGVQKDDGSWDESYFTGTGFPGYGIGQRLGKYPEQGDPQYQGTELPAGFMINYHLYRNYWPLMALGRYRQDINQGRSTPRRSKRDPSDSVSMMA